MKIYYNRRMRPLLERIPFVTLYANGWSAGPLTVTTGQRSARLAWEWQNAPSPYRDDLWAARASLHLTVGHPAVHHWWAFHASLSMPQPVAERTTRFRSTGYRTLIH